MTSQLIDSFSKARQEKRPVFIPFVTAGFPSIHQTTSIMLKLEASGADIIELGIPFSDPLADGPTIQYANQVALQNGITYAGCLDIIKQARAQGLKVPIILMGYYNPLIAFGESQAVQLAKESGANGFIVVDLPPDRSESSEFLRLCERHEMSFIPLVAITTSEHRIKGIVDTGSSFVYCVSVTGVTGTRASIGDEVPEFLKRVQKATDLPIAVGFGISSREQFKDIAGMCDGVVIGSALINCIRTAFEKKKNVLEAVEAFCKSVLVD